jgi:hypothetical protein
MAVLAGLVISLSGIISIWALSPLAVGVVDDPVSKFAVVTGSAEFALTENGRTGELMVAGNS